MDNNAGMTAIGVGLLGFGILFLFSAYSKVPIFGPKGLITAFLIDPDMEKAGKAVGDFAREAAEWSKKQKPAATTPGGKGGAVTV